MTEFARTVTRNNAIDADTRALHRNIAVILVIYLGICWFILWANARPKPKAEAPLTTVKTIQSHGKYKLNGARGIALDKSGQIYVADSRNDRVVIYSPAGAVRGTIGGRDGRRDRRIKYPTAVAVSGSKVYVGSYGSGEVLVYSKKGKLLDVLPHQEDRIHLPAVYSLSMACDSRGNLYVADGKKNCVMQFDGQGKLRLVFGGTGYGEGQMRYVNGLAVDERKRLIIVLDSGNLRIQLFNMEGKFLQQVTYKEDRRPVMTAPRGLAYNPATGIIYIADSLLDTVFKVDGHGTIIARASGGMSYPNSLALSASGYLYVTQREAGRIAVLNP